jgi:hypothetical protein
LEVQDYVVKECVRKKLIRLQKGAGKDLTVDLLNKCVQKDVFEHLFPNLALVGRDQVPSYTLVGLKRVNTIKDIRIGNPELRQHMFEF